MAKVLVKRYVHSSYECNSDLVEKYGHADLRGVCYEVEVLVELDTETGESTVVGCDGKMLGDQPYPENIETV